MDFENMYFFENTIEFFLSHVKCGKKLVMFGAGNEMYRALKKLIIPHKLTVDYIVDNDFRKWYWSCHGIEVKEPEYLASEDKDKLVVLITSLYPYRIEQQLQRLGVKYYYSSLLFLEEHIGKGQFMVSF